jgi:hypothetical protein
MIPPMTDLSRLLSRVLPLAALTVLAPLAACHKSESPAAADGTAPAAAPATTAAAPPAPITPLTVVALSIGKSVGPDGKVAAEADTFAPGDTVYASVGTTGGSPAAKLTVRWAYFTTGGAEKPISEESKTIAPTADAATEFHVAKPEGWTAGDYKVEILLDGQSVATKAFRVAK